MFKILYMSEGLKSGLFGKLKENKLKIGGVLLVLVVASAGVWWWKTHCGYNKKSKENKNKNAMVNEGNMNAGDSVSPDASMTSENTMSDNESVQEPLV